MLSQLLRILRLGLCVCALLFASGLATGCGAVTGPYTPKTSVAPLPTDDLSQPCRYDMVLSAPQVVQAGVLVIFERADSATLFQDPAVRAMAVQQHLAMVYAYQCNAASFNDLQWDAAKGPGRALFLALSQFATETEHPELATANVILYGFSAAGYLAVTMTKDYPGRVLGAIPDAPATAYANFDLEAATSAIAQIPMLILANAEDMQAGTQRPFDFFVRGHGMGAPWGFGVQNGTGHCCTDSTSSLLIPWVTAVMTEYTVPSTTGSVTLRPNIGPVAPTVAFTCSYDHQSDVLGEGDCSLTSVSILPAMNGGVITAWLPDATVAHAWYAWVTNPTTN